MARPLSPVSAAVGPEVTNPVPEDVPVAVLDASTAAAPDALDSPEYSSAAPPMSALPVAVMVIAGRVPPPAVIGALQTLSSVSSDAVTLVTLVYVLPAASATPEIVAPSDAPHARHDDDPVAGRDGRRRRQLQGRSGRRYARTRAGRTAGPRSGWHGLDAAESGPVPTEFVAATVNV